MKITQIPQVTQSDIDSVGDPIIMTATEARAAAVAAGKEPRPRYPDISCVFTVWGSELAEVHINLLDTGNEDNGVIQYDADIYIGNGDSVGMVAMCQALAICLAKFDQMGLNTRFGTITGQ